MLFFRKHIQGLGPCRRAKTADCTEKHPLYYTTSMRGCTVQIAGSGDFSTLVGEATKHCYGVAAMAPRDMTDAVRSLVHGSDYSEKGVRVTQENGRLVIELHIAVSYGLNISTAARSISHRVKDEVEQATGLKVARVVVSVDDVIA